jgi:A/G-specific adenine glycosylase
MDMLTFIDLVLARGRELYRDFAWRRTSDPYAVLLSEVMLQQTQTSRVARYYDNWLQRFPTIDALAAASTSDVLEAWQGLGYNRRALALKRLANQVSETAGGILPTTYDDLLALPGIGPATAAGVLAFAQDSPAPYLETNVRTVFLHHFFPATEGVSDKELLLLVREAGERVHARNISARTWNYALLDYGVELKRTLPNPSRRSKHHSRQSAYEGSNRQKRAALLAAVLADPGHPTAEYARACAYDLEVTEDVLGQLATEGFITPTNEATWTLP